MEDVLFVMSGQDVLQKSFSTSGWPLMMIGLCAAIKADKCGPQCCVQVDNHLVF